MKESAQNNDKKKRSYLNMGKYTKGFWCMVTFFVFALSVILTIFGIALFGSEIITSTNSSYFESRRYETDLSLETANLLYNIVSVADGNKKFSITYVEEGMIKEYASEVYSFGIHNWETFFENEEAYLTDTKNYASSRFYDMSTLKIYLNSSLSENNYLYFSENAFQNLFKESGLMNTGYRFSVDFPENAYFVFECDTEIKQFLERAKNAKSIVDEMTYAVYDPEKDLYYSTLDDYFSPMNRYIYNSTALKATLEEEENNILFLLLRSLNLEHHSMWDEVMGEYENMYAQKDLLDSRDGSNFLYYFESPSYSAKNVKVLSDITNLPYAYQVEKGELKFIGSSNNGIRNYDVFYDIMMSAYEECPAESVFYFGLKPEGAVRGDSSEIVSKMYLYEIYSVGTKVAVVVAILAFILLMVQAISMLRATGKEKADSVEIKLNRYDKLPTEIWLVINVVILAACIFIFVVVVGNLYDPIYWDVFEYMMVSACALPFGFFFMILTLSAARRVKARNLWKGSLLNWFICRLAGKKVVLEDGAEMQTVPKSKLALKLHACKEYICNIKGTKKFLLVFGIYIAVSILLCIFAIQCHGDEPLFLFLLLQMVALGAIIWIVKDIDKLIQGVTEITKGNLNYKVEINEKASVFRELADGINHIGDGLKSAVETSLKDERMKTELITNVSHDLKTPLTSIINYIDLLKKEDIQSEESKHYIEVLDAKSQRLKQLTEDLVEAAKATSGNIELEMMPLTFDELMKQALGEFEDKFEKRNLTVIATYPGEPAVIIADGRRLFRIIENVLQNVYKYALEGTRVYVDLSKCDGMVIFTLKNISASPLNISPEELMERFTRGDSSRTTEGSGLGLSIAKDLTRLQSGEFVIQLDGDLFKVIIKFPQHNS